MKNEVTHAIAIETSGEYACSVSCYGKADEIATVDALTKSRPNCRIVVYAGPMDQYGRPVDAKGNRVQL